MKSAQSETDLLDIQKIISHIKEKFGCKIRGHEIHQRLEDLERDTLRERANLVSSFCSKNDMEFITYHVPIARNQGPNLLIDDRANASILSTIKEVEMVVKECGLVTKAVIINHLSSVISSNQIRYLNKGLKFEILENAEGRLIDFCRQNSDYFNSFATLTLENVFPKYFTNGDNFATINMFHPMEMVRLKKYGIKVTFDLSHYSIYSNCLLYKRGNKIVDLERQIYGSTVPSWNECVDLFGDSLIQLHISDSRGTDASGEGLMVGTGGIPIRAILQSIKKAMRIPVRSSIELRDGHLYNGILQRKAAEWLLLNMADIFD